MNSPYQYDVFVSHATSNADIANLLVEKLEARGFKCFIAPRNLTTGMDFATCIINGISNSAAFLLVFSSQSDRSAYVLREINSAVSRNKTIIPLRIENFLPSEAMEFYLGPTQWLNAFPNVLDSHLDSVCTTISGITPRTLSVTQNNDSTDAPTVLDVSETLKLGYSYTDIMMKSIELDYLCIPPDKFKMDEDTEGTPEEWSHSVKEHSDATCCLIHQDEMIGYCDMFPVELDSYDDLIQGKVMIRENMIDLYKFGGHYPVYIAMLAVTPERASQDNFFLIFDWIFKRLYEWRSEGIEAVRIGISVYSELLEKFVKRFGFEFAAINPARGKVYQVEVENLKDNPFVQKRYPFFANKL